MGIRIRDLIFSYDKNRILNGISMDIERGEFVSIIGPNGTGKSTLVQCINGILKIQQGVLSIYGMNIRHMNYKDIASYVSYVPQVSTSLFHMNVLDMVLLGRRPFMTWKHRKSDKLIALKALEALNIAHLAMRRFDELSGGQKQKVIIARALAQQAEIIILDEPINHLDIRHQIEVMDILKRLVKEENVTVIGVIHDLNIATKYSDKVVILNRGEIVDIGKPNRVLTKENIAKVYGVEIKHVHFENEMLIVPYKITCN